MSEFCHTIYKYLNKYIKLLFKKYEYTTKNLVLVKYIHKHRFKINYFYIATKTLNKNLNLYLEIIRKFNLKSNN